MTKLQTLFKNSFEIRVSLQDELGTTILISLKFDCKKTFNPNIIAYVPYFELLYILFMNKPYINVYINTKYQQSRNVGL